VFEELNAAKESAYVQAYSFTSAPIAKALVDAHKRGVSVTVLLAIPQCYRDLMVAALRRAFD